MRISPQTAVDLHRISYVNRERTLGPSHPDTLYSLAWLGASLSNLGMLEEAEEMQRLCLEVTETDSFFFLRRKTHHEISLKKQMKNSEKN